MKNLILTLVICFVSANAWTKVEYDSTTLVMKTSEQVTELVRKKIKQAADIQAQQEDSDEAGLLAEPEAITKLKEAMRIILSRPDKDGARADIFARIRRELSDLNSFDKVMAELTDEAVSALKSSGLKENLQVTYVVLLENLMAELKPDLSKKAAYKAMVEKIRDADIKIDKKVITNAKLRTMTSPVSPSETAKKILPKK